MSITTKNGSFVTEEQMEAVAEAFERGEWPEGETRIVRGRPRMFDEKLRSVSFKETGRKISALDRKASAAGMSRSDYLRKLVDQDLATA